jgi:hypothetical protein
MAQDVIQWASPSPLWPAATAGGDALSRQRRLRRPAILRFASDEFMEQFLALLENDPSRLGELVAKPETWRGPLKEQEPVKQAPAFARKLQRLGLLAARRNGAASSPATASVGTATLTGAPSKKAPKLKLYQPAHQRFYLVTSCLVCGRAGLPDRAVAPSRQERVGFVVRRLAPPQPLNIKQTLPEIKPDEWEEYAFVVAPDGQGWKRILREKRGELEEGEELLPLFPVNFTEDAGRRRRLLAGLVPVGRREAYVNASQRRREDDPDPVVKPAPLPDARMLLVWSQVTEPWKRLIERADAARIVQGVNTLPSDPQRTSQDKPISDDAAALAASMKATRELIQTGSWYVLLDFAKFLEEHINDVWQKSQGQTPQQPLTTAQENLIDALTNTTLAVDLKNALLLDAPHYNIEMVKTTLKDALISVRPPEAETAEKIEGDLDKVVKSYDRKEPDAMWPDFLFPLADCEHPAPLPPAEGSDDPSKLEDRLNRLDRLAKLIEDALPPQPAGDAPAIPLAAKPVMDTRESWFVIRCVFERPECGPVDPPLLSEPTEAFQMAGFFDPDAPARPIRIALPIDTTPAGLRKFDKNAAFMISDVLCGQIDRVKSLSLGDLVRSVLPWPLHKDLSVPDGGPCKDSGDASLSVGMICSFSLPIITICALIMLMIIVTLLDIIFRWIPYFFICFPLPGFKAKE